MPSRFIRAIFLELGVGFKGSVHVCLYLLGLC